MTDEIAERLKGVEVVVGLDASMNGAAFCVATSEKKYETAIYAADLPASPRADDRIRRLMDHADVIVDGIAKIVKRRRCLVVIEAYVDSGYGGTSLTLAELGGMLRRKILETLNVALIVEPTTGAMKKYVCGNGGGDKTRTIAFIARHYNLPIDTAENDRYDAFGLGLVGLGLIGKMVVNDERKQILADLFVTTKQKKMVRAKASIERKLRQEQSREAKKAELEKRKADREAAAAQRKADKEAAAQKRAADAAAKKEAKEAAARERAAKKAAKTAKPVEPEVAPTRPGKILKLD